VYAYFNRGPGEAMDPVLADFLGYVLSAEGQAAVQPEDGYLALNPAQAAAQLQRLK
jgi:phosphate transport system substrate-binding protein